MVPAPLKSSLVQFAGFRADALVRIGADVRAAAETQNRPFKIATPPEGSTAMVHSVPYEVMVGGNRIQAGTVAVVPGRPMTIERKAE